MSDIEKLKYEIINVLKETIVSLDDFTMECCDDYNIFREGLSQGLQISIEIIKRGSNRKLIEYTLDSYK